MKSETFDFFRNLSISYVTIHRILKSIDRKPINSFFDISHFRANIRENSYVPQIEGGQVAGH